MATIHKKRSVIEGHSTSAPSTNEVPGTEEQEVGSSLSNLSSLIRKTLNEGEEEEVDEEQEEEEILAQSFLVSVSSAYAANNATDEPQPELPPKSAYVMWMTEEMYKEKAKNKDFMFAIFSKQCGERWKRLDERTRAEWERKYAQRQIDFWWWGESSGRSSYIKTRPPKKKRNSEQPSVSNED